MIQNEVYKIGEVEIQKKKVLFGEMEIGTVFVGWDPAVYPKFAGGPASWWVKISNHLDNNCKNFLDAYIITIYPSAAYWLVIQEEIIP